MLRAVGYMVCLLVGIVSVSQAFDSSWRAVNSRLKTLARMAPWDSVWLFERKLSYVVYFHLIRNSFGRIEHIVHIEKDIFLLICQGKTVCTFFKFKKCINLFLYLEMQEIISFES